MVKDDDMSRIEAYFLALIVVWVISGEYFNYDRNQKTERLIDVSESNILLYKNLKKRVEALEER